MQVKCIARIHDVYQQSNERFIEEERPRVTSLASSNNHHNNIGLTYNSYNPEDNEVEGKENYLDNIKGRIYFHVSLKEVKGWKH
jgi:hypothetical protein